MRKTSWAHTAGHSGARAIGRANLADINAGDLAPVLAGGSPELGSGAASGQKRGGMVVLREETTNRGGARQVVAGEGPAAGVARGG